MLSCQLKPKGRVKRNLSEYHYHSPFIAHSIRIASCPESPDFCLLDDPALVDRNGVRIPAGGDIEEPVDTTSYHFDFDFGSKVMGIDGAVLEASDVTIPAGKQLRFFWLFLPYDTSDANFCDFALFHVYQDGQADPDNPLYETVLATTFRQSLSWQEARWPENGPLDHDFHGSLCWVSSNGLRYVGDPPASIPAAASARPSALLIGGIDQV